MLTKKERHGVLKDFKRACDTCLFPTEVHPESWEVRPRRDKECKMWICKLSYALFIAHALYKMFRLAHTILFLRDVPLHQVIIHAVLAVAGIMYIFWYYWLHYKYANVNSAYVRITLTGNATGGNANIYEISVMRSHPFLSQSAS